MMPAHIYQSGALGRGVDTSRRALSSNYATFLPIPRLCSCCFLDSNLASPLLPVHGHPCPIRAHLLLLDFASQQVRCCDLGVESSMIDPMTPARVPHLYVLCPTPTPANAPRPRFYTALYCFPVAHSQVLARHVFDICGRLPRCISRKSACFHRRATRRGMRRGVCSTPPLYLGPSTMI